MKTTFASLKNSGFWYCVSWHVFFAFNDLLGRIEIYGFDKAPKRNCIIVANHVSFLDPPTMSVFHNDNVSVIARDTLMKNPILRIYFSALNAIPIKRGGNDFGAIREALKRIKNGHSLIIFPEGTRTEDGNLLRAKPGAAMLALKAKIPVLPIRSFGYFKIMPKSNKVTAGTRITIIAGNPINVADIDPQKGDHNRAQIIADCIMEHIAKIKYKWHYHV